MAKTWGGKSYDSDFYEIDAQGQRLSGEKDWQANRDWNAVNDRSQINNFSPEILAKTGGVKPTPGSTGGGATPAPFAWDNPGDDWGGASNPPWVGGGGQPGGPSPPVKSPIDPNDLPSFGGGNGSLPPGMVGLLGSSPGGQFAPVIDAQGNTVTSGNGRGQAAAQQGGQQAYIGGSSNFDETTGTYATDDGPATDFFGNGTGGLANGSNPSTPIGVTPPNLDNAALLSQLQGPQALGQVSGPANLGAMAGPQALGQVQGPQALGQMQGPAALGQVQGPQALGQVQGPQALGQVQGPQALGQVQGPQALGQLGAAPQVAAAGPTSQFGQSVQGSIQQGLSDPSVNPNDPAYKAQMDAFSRNAQRSAERMRASAAQRANATGTLGSGGFDAGVNRILQNQGAEEADFEARLMQSELNAGRERQARAQQLGAGLFSQEQQQGLTERLANQGAGVTAMGYNNQRDLANQGTAMQTLGLNSTRDLANVSSQQQTQALNTNRDLANLSSQQQTMGLNSGRDLANLSSAQQTQALNSGRDQSNVAAQLQAMGLNSGRDLANLSSAQQTQALNSGRDQSNIAAQLQAMGYNNQRDLSNQSSALQMAGLNSGRDLANQGAQLQTMGLNNQRDLTSYGAQNQRDLTRYGGQLQAGLANQGARMQQRGYNLQRDLGLRDLGLRDKQIGNQDSQYYAGLGQNLGLETARLNQDALLRLLGGG